ncbi:amidohydrolase family protein [Paenirhodobacter populi]|uniref:Amidohydrolase n=1 Tax=Paenirhodobacter populi TaxID=2306993 RepID=A0A443JKF3_9RHOB|nr:amidohydrolase [Sinirhodobacter populi]RWR20476.1 amidohydrolase [Sinirhodobacter populi]
MSRLILKNGMVLTLDEAGTYHEEGSVIIEADRITAIVPGHDSVAPQAGDRVIDATDKIIMPGLIDLHYHTAIGKGYNDHMPLWEYLDECWYPLVRALDPEAAYWAAMASYAESIKSGVTTVNDMYRQLDSLADAACDIGMRAVLCNDVALPEHDLDTLETNKDAFHKNHGRGNGLIEVRVGIEWVPLSSPGLLRDARALANDLGAGLHIHLNESKTEVEFSLKQFGKRPTELAYEAGFLGPDCVAAHCVHLSDDEIRMIAETGTHISHNPNSNAKLGNGVARLPEFLAAGINVGLGHDAVECNNSADMFEVMKWASLVHRAHRADASLCQAADVLRMATNNGARALGHQTGALKVGNKADIILIETQSPIFTPLLRDTPVQMTSHLVFASNSSVVDTTIINGEVVMQGRVLTRANEREIVQKANAAFVRMKEKMVVVRRAQA